MDANSIIIATDSLLLKQVMGFTSCLLQHLGRAAKFNEHLEYCGFEVFTSCVGLRAALTSLAGRHTPIPNRLLARVTRAHLATALGAAHKSGKRRPGAPIGAGRELAISVEQLLDGDELLRLDQPPLVVSAPEQLSFVGYQPRVDWILEYPAYHARVPAPLAGGGGYPPPLQL